MLRPIRCPYIGTRLIPLRTTVTRGGLAMVKGINDIALLDSSGAGVHEINLRRPHQQYPGAIGCAWTTVANGAITGMTASGMGSLTMQVSDDAGDGADGTLDTLVVGFDSQHKFAPTDHFVAHHNVYGANTFLRVLSFNISDAGALTSGGDQATLVDGGVGIYTLNFTHPFVQAPFVFGTVVKTTAGVVNVHASSATSVTIKIFDDAGTAQDYEANILVIGQDSGDTSGGHSRVVNTPYRRAMLYPVGIVITAGTPALVAGAGAEIFSLTDSGAGIYTLAYTKGSLGRAGEVYVVADDDKIATVESVSTSGFVIRTFTHAGVAADAATVSGFALFFDDDDTFF